MTSQWRDNDHHDEDKNEGLCQSQNLYGLFQRDGFVGPIDVLTEDEANHAYKDIQEELLRSSSMSGRRSGAKGKDGNSINSSNSRFKLHLIIPSVDKIVHHPNVVKAVRDVLGLTPETNDQLLLLWSSDVNIKRTGSNGVFEPHQDSTYAGLSDPSKCVTVWIALCPTNGGGVTKENGGLLFWPQSHTVGQIPHNQRRDDDESDKDKNNKKSNNMLCLGQYISKDELDKLPIVNDRNGDDDPFVSIPLKVGQATIHSFYNVHASGPNLSSLSSSQDRVGIALRYMAGNGQVEQLKTKAREMVTVIVVGGDGCSDRLCPNNDVSSTQELQMQGFDVEPRLPPNPTPQDIERQRSVRDEAMRREEANYFG